MSAAQDGAPAALSAALQRTVAGARMRLQTPPGLNDLALWLVDATSLAALDDRTAAAIAAAPPYWCVAWPAGQVLAARIAAAPGDVRGRTVVDFGSGCGIVAIAAARAGAAHTIAIDCDADARAATAANAAQAGVSVTVVATIAAAAARLDGGRCDLLCAADVLYDRDNGPMFGVLRALSRRVWIADCRVAWHDDAPVGDLRTTAQHDAAVFPDLDRSRQFRRVHVWEDRGCAPP